MAELLKNYFDIHFSRQLANAIAGTYPTLDQKKLVAKIHQPQWEQLELKQRMVHISECLHQFLPQPYSKASKILKKIAPQFTGLTAMCLPEYPRMYGLEHWDESMSLMAELTKYSSSEFAVRPFYQQDYQAMHQQMLIWSKDQNEHVRRLASEGARPSLPWAIKVKDISNNPLNGFKILENLMKDPSPYVRKSVANHLNDISKLEPKAVIQFCQKFIHQNLNTDKLIKHGLRTLLKKGHQEALSFFSFQTITPIKVSQMQLQKNKIAIGKELVLEFAITSKPSEQNLRIELVIAYLKANGSHHEKVFRVSETKITTGKKVFQKKILMKNLTTRKHYQGTQYLYLQINGKKYPKLSFELV